MQTDGLLVLGKAKSSLLRQQNEFEQQQQTQQSPYDKVLEKSTKDLPSSGGEPYFDKSVSHNVTVAENSTANLYCRPMNTGKKSVSCAHFFKIELDSVFFFYSAVGSLLVCRTRKISDAI